MASEKTSNQPPVSFSAMAGHPLSRAAPSVAAAAPLSAATASTSSSPDMNALYNTLASAQKTIEPLRAARFKAEKAYTDAAILIGLVSPRPERRHMVLSTTKPSTPAPAPTKPTPDDMRTLIVTFLSAKAAYDTADTAVKQAQTAIQAALKAKGL